MRDEQIYGDGTLEPEANREGALWEIAAERKRQIEKEGWSLAHDDSHDTGDLAYAGACYALAGTGLALKDWLAKIIDRLWPWDHGWYKIANKSKRQRLIVAGALIVAEIERLDRASAHGQSMSGEK